MSSVKQRDTKPEKLVRSLIHRMGFRFRKNVKTLPGKPDIVLPKYKAIVFVHGCFWHGHENCKKAKLPETRKEFWERKINGNLERDLKNEKELIALGWRVFTVWTCQLKTKDAPAYVQKLASEIKNVRL
jgi:DNA mismatch endonuclease (patch repair protein)